MCKIVIIMKRIIKSGNVHARSKKQERRKKTKKKTKKKC